MIYNIHLSQYPMWNIIRQCNYSWSATLPKLPKGLSPAGYQHNVIKVGWILKLTTFSVRIQNTAHCAESDVSSNEATTWQMIRGTAVLLHVWREPMTLPVQAEQQCHASHGVLTVSSATSLALHDLFSWSHPEQRHDNNSKWNLPKKKASEINGTCICSEQQVESKDQLNTVRKLTMSFEAVKSFCDMKGWLASLFPFVSFSTLASHSCNNREGLATLVTACLLHLIKCADWLNTRACCFSTQTSPLNQWIWWSMRTPHPLLCPVAPCENIHSQTSLFWCSVQQSTSGFTWG